MYTHQTDSESLDRLVLLLASRPREGWENIYEEASRREVERLAPHPQQVKSLAAGLSGRGLEDGTKTKEHSAYGCIIHD
jgi:hypothetical protein